MEVRTTIRNNGINSQPFVLKKAITVSLNARTIMTTAHKARRALLEPERRTEIKLGGDDNYDAVNVVENLPQNLDFQSTTIFRVMFSLWLTKTIQHRM